MSALDSEACYRAVQARDRRMDGQFFTGVVTTGIFCRPICPARTPLRQNVRFFRSASAALAAGLRPCLRCRPEVAPGSAAASGTAATVRRALRLIDEGALDGQPVGSAPAYGAGPTPLARLAHRLGVSERHLRRLFLAELGASPVQVAQTRRILLARALLADSDLPVSAVAFAAGYSSLRRFNAAIRSGFGRPPSALRSARRVHSPASDEFDPDDLPGARVSLSLPVRGVLDWTRVIAQFGSRLIRGVETVEGLTWRRTIRLGEGAHAVPAILSLGCEGPPNEAPRVRLGINLLARPPSQPELSQPGLLPQSLSAIDSAAPRSPVWPQIGAIRARVSAMLDLDADVEAIAGVLAADELLAAGVAARPNLRLLGAWDRFELGVRAILGQQVSIAAGATLASRLVERCGQRLAEGPDPALFRLFPTPEEIAGADLSALGVPATRAATLRRFAEACAADPLFLDLGTGVEDFLARLTALPGIGPWTAQYIALRGAGEPDAFPASDLVLLKAARLRDPNLTTPRALALRAERWRPWRGYAARHLWAMASEGTASASD